MKKILIVLLTALSMPALAGSSSITCTTDNKDIEINMTNSEEPRIKFYTTSDSQPVIYDYPLNLMPDLSWSKSKNAIIAIPFADRTYLSKSRQTLRLIHKDGTWCDGRQRWDETYAQRFVLTAKAGAPLLRLAPTTLGKYMTRDMYLVTALTCHSKGVTSTGGCYHQDGDIETWIDDGE
ncbi:hypothetical protein [Bdellovibrio sp. HCB337]|uniref:hypothetical protein n=1 Tax=Bdellovibrio sp. HCB337 TaxID=3394358 RepID=UPI0039A4287C